MPPYTEQQRAYWDMRCIQGTRSESSASARFELVYSARFFLWDAGPR